MRKKANRLIPKIRSSLSYYLANNEHKRSRGTLAEIEDYAEDQ